MGGLIGEFAMTRSVRDAARLLEAVSGTGPGDPYDAGGADDFGAAFERPSSRLRVGLHPVAEHPAAREAVWETGRVLEEIGHVVEESYPAALDEPGSSRRKFEVFTAFAEFALQWWERALGEALTADDVEPLTWWLAEQSRARTPGDYLSTVEWNQGWARRLSAWWGDGFDVLVTPTMSQPPPRIGHRFDPDNPRQIMADAAATVGRTMEWNITGSPAISLPVSIADGMPQGIQLVAARGQDRLLLEVAGQLEHARPWHERRPPNWV